MLQTLNPYTSTAKTAEIMARYRPIAPRPQASLSSNAGGSGGGGDDASVSASASSSSQSSMSPTIRQSPYLRNVWPHLQSRPTRTRKRGRTSLGPPPPSSFKRPRTLLQGLSPPFHVTTSPARSLSIQGFAPLPATTHPTTLVTLPLLPSSSSSSSPGHHMQQPPNVVVDLNKVAEIPEEKDLLAQLQKPTTANLIYSPTPIRLVPSTVTIRAIKEDDATANAIVNTITGRISFKKSEEIEKELESQTLPAFVSDSNNKVRLVNSAYNKMVGQPDCGWLESMEGLGFACKSICGQVMLNFMDLDPISVLSGGFSCWARIEWEMNGKKKIVNAFGESMRLACESKDYKFAWRFHTREASETASNV